MSRLLGSSVVLHLALLAAIFYIPAVRNALNIAGSFSNTKYVDKDYNKTMIGERAVMIDPNTLFQYPEGYFSNGVVVAEAQPQIIEEAKVIPQQPPPSLPRTARIPKQQPTPAASPAASPAPGPVAGTGGQTVATTEKPKTSEEADKEIDKVAAENGIVRPNEDTINKRPLKDWLARANDLKVKGELDLTKPVEIVIESELGADGKLINPVVVQKSGDPRLQEIAKEMAAAISDSGVLVFLKDPKQPNLNIKQMRLTLRLDQNIVTAQVESELETAERAQKVASGYNLLLALGQVKKSGQDEEVLYKNTKVTANGKQVVVNFTLPRNIAEAMIKKQLPAT